MGDSTKISWTDATWNPIRGCRRTAPAGSKQSGCGDPTGGGCYAERQAARFSGPGQAYVGLITLTKNGPRWSGKTKFVAEHLADPLRWKKPRRIFVDSMSDLFYDGFTNEQIAAVFGVMAAAPQHTFQVLTKRAKRMREWFDWLDEQIEQAASDLSGALCDVSIHQARDVERVAFMLDRAEEVMPSDAAKRAIAAMRDDEELYDRWPLSNVWLGVSVENQAAADERIHDLLFTPAAMRFVSCEPLLGPLHLKCHSCGRPLLGHDEGRAPDCTRLWPHWVIAGCESGPKSRECQVDWLRSLRDQCASTNVAFFLKQAIPADGSLASDCARPAPIDIGPDARWKHNGVVIELPYLDGKQHAAFPEVVR